MRKEKERRKGGETKNRKKRKKTLNSPRKLLSATLCLSPSYTLMVTSVWLSLLVEKVFFCSEGMVEFLEKDV